MERGRTGSMHKILLVDDMRSFLDLEATFLSRAECHLLTASTGLEAIRRIRAEEKWTRLPIIALTAKAAKDDREQCIAAGANDYAPKPLDVETLLSLVRVWMPK